MVLESPFESFKHIRVARDAIIIRDILSAEVPSARRTNDSELIAGNNKSRHPDHAQDHTRDHPVSIFTTVHILRLKLHTVNCDLTCRDRGDTTK